MHENAGAPRRSTVVVADSLAARQWELYLAVEQIQSGASAWEAPPVMSYAAWLETLWLEQTSAAVPPLSAGQSDALWRRVVAESAEGAELIGHAGAAQWAREAWRLLARWRIDPATERAGADQIDYGAFLRWCKSYRRRLEEHGWVDGAELEAKLAAQLGVVGACIATDLDDPYPARKELWSQLARRGSAPTTLTAPPCAGVRHTARLVDAAEELRVALEWAKRILARDQRARVAVVVPGAAQRRDEIERQLATVFGGDEAALCWSGTRTLRAEPLVGSAAAALALADSATPYVAFGRWLRSPFFGVPSEAASRAKLDRRLRRDLRSQLPFAAAYRCGVRELLDDAAPLSGAALAAALAIVGNTRRATPSRWAHLFARYLTVIGWQPPLTPGLLQGWQGSLDELARLTPILGEISLAAALAELERILDRGVPPALPFAGVHVLAALDDVGPGYAAVWVTGFTDTVWPEPAHGDPLLPLALQRTHAMPYSSPSDAQLRSARKLERLVQRTPKLVISWPARVYDYETEPSPAIRNWPSLPADELAALTRVGPVTNSAARETVHDAAPALGAQRLPGGSGALGRQARCPIRAFCQDRLGAEAIERLRLGLSARLRGIATHRAAELLFAGSPSQADIAMCEPPVAQSAEQALASVFGATRGRLGELFALEVERLERVLRSLLRSEATRAWFRVRAVEQKSDVALGRWTLGTRVDRIDELADGSIAIIDYKTNERATSADWFTRRLRDAQVPLYACNATDVGAAVIARLGASEATYSGLWREAAFPGRPARQAAEQSEQLATWRAQLLTLATELANGDTRIFVVTPDDAAGAYAPLTRVFEQLELVRGTQRKW
jgi:probable DNA repair protein